jgi:DNA-directed RNA polymerase alpha subunit
MDTSGGRMKIHVEFNSLGEMVSFGKFVGNDLVQLPPTTKQKAQDSKYKEMYETTLANLERAYERLRMVDPNGITANKTEKELEASVESALELSVRAMNCLHSEQIFSLKDLLKISFYDLQKIPNCGRITAREIQDAVERLGYKLLHTPPNA